MRANIHSLPCRNFEVLKHFYVSQILLYTKIRLRTTTRNRMICQHWVQEKWLCEGRKAETAINADNTGIVFNLYSITSYIYMAYFNNTDPDEGIVSQTSANRKVVFWSERKLLFDWWLPRKVDRRTKWSVAREKRPKWRYYYHRLTYQWIKARRLSHCREITRERRRSVLSG